MAYIPPQNRSPRQPMHPLAKRLLWTAAALIAIPVVAYGLFLAAVLVYAAINGPIRWN